MEEGTRWTAGGRGPRRAALPRGLRSLVLGEGIGFWAAFGQPFRLGVLPGAGTHYSEDGCPQEGFWEVESS